MLTIKGKEQTEGYLMDIIEKKMILKRSQKFPFLSRFIVNIKREWLGRLEFIEPYPSDENDNIESWSRHFLLMVEKKKNKRISNAWHVISKYFNVNITFYPPLNVYI